MHISAYRFSFRAQRASTLIMRVLVFLARAFGGDDGPRGAIEYGLMLALLAVSVLGALFLLRDYLPGFVELIR